MPLNNEFILKLLFKESIVINLCSPKLLWMSLNPTEKFLVAEVGS
jgi:hypothetical protein